MKKFLIITLMAGFLLAACQQKTNNSMTTQEEIKNATLTSIHSRRSVRHFESEKVISKESLDTLLRAGMAAASAVNLQPWQFVVVDNRAIMDSLSEGLPYAKMLKKASAAIIVCGDTSIKSGEMAFWIYDCSLASANILLAAESMGLGALWTAVHPDEARIATVKKVLYLPENIIPLNVIPIGYPTGEDMPKNKYDTTKIHWNRF